jgi:hypothetical protein
LRLRYPQDIPACKIKNQDTLHVPALLYLDQLFFLGGEAMFGIFLLAFIALEAAATAFIIIGTMPKKKKPDKKKK